MAKLFGEIPCREIYAVCPSPDSAWMSRMNGLTGDGTAEPGANGHKKKILPCSAYLKQAWATTIPVDAQSVERDSHMAGRRKASFARISMTLLNRQKTHTACSTNFQWYHLDRVRDTF